MWVTIKKFSHLYIEELRGGKKIHVACEVPPGGRRGGSRLIRELEVMCSSVSINSVDVLLSNALNLHLLRCRTAEDWVHWLLGPRCECVYPCRCVYTLGKPFMDKYKKINIYKDSYAMGNYAVI